MSMVIGQCPKCNRKVTTDHKFRYPPGISTNPEHVDCASPNGWVVTGQKFSKPDQPNTTLKKEGAK